MPDLPSPLSTLSNGSWNTDATAVIRSYGSTPGPFGSFDRENANYLARPPERDVYRTVQGFKIISATTILHIQLFDQYFDFKIDSLGATWAGCWVLLWHGYWIHLCTQLYRTCRTWLGHKGRQNYGTTFSVEKEGDEFIIRGGCSPYAPRWKEAVLEECWTGKLLLVERNGDWMRLFRRNQKGKETPLRIMVDPEEAAKKAKEEVKWLHRLLGKFGMKYLESSVQAL